MATHHCSVQLRSGQARGQIRLVFSQAQAHGHLPLALDRGQARGKTHLVHRHGIQCNPDGPRVKFLRTATQVAIRCAALPPSALAPRRLGCGLPHP